MVSRRAILSILALLLSACGGDDRASHEALQAEIERTRAQMDAEADVASDLVEAKSREVDDRLYVILATAQGLTEEQAENTVHAARQICNGLSAAGEMGAPSFWKGLGRTVDAQGEEMGHRMRIAAVTGVEVFCPELEDLVPLGFAS